MMFLSTGSRLITQQSCCTVKRLAFVLLCIATLLYHVKGFVSPTIVGASTQFRGKSQHDASFDLVDQAIQTTSNAILIATIDADVASLSENEFKPVFMGGLVVMFGGLISALMVGLIVDKRNLYASLVADSYAQSGEDEEFWKGLSEEEKNKAQDLIRKFKGSQSSSNEDDKLLIVSKTAAERKDKSNNNTDQELKVQESTLFSDYGNEI